MKTVESIERSKASVMKRMSLVAILTLATLMPAVASRGGEQKQGGNKCRKEVMMKRPDAETIALHKAKVCRKELRLNDEQYNQVFKIYKKAFSEMARKDQQAVSEQDRANMRATIDKQMSKVLTEVQFAEWKQMKHHASGGKHLKKRFDGHHHHFNKAKS